MDGEYNNILGEIRDTLLSDKNPEGAGALLKEVSLSMKGGSENTVRTAIQNMESSLLKKLDALQNAIKSGTVAGATPALDATAGLINKTSTMQGDKLDKIIEELGIIAESRGGGTGHSENSSAFELRALTSRYHAVDNLISIAQTDSLTGFKKMREVIEQFTGSAGILQNQYKARQETAILGLINIATKSTDLINIFEKLGGVIKAQVISGYQTFQSGRSTGLSGMQNLFDEFERMVAHGPLNAGFSYKMTNEQLEQHGAGGGTPTTLLYGQNPAQMSQKFDQILNQMQAKGFDPLTQFGGPEAIIRAIQDNASFMKQSGIFDKMKEPEQTQLMMQSMRYMSDISKYTGISAEKLSEMAKSVEAEAVELQALGNLTAEQAQAFRNNVPALQSMGAGGMQKYITEMIRANGDEAMFRRNNPDVNMIDQLMQGTFVPAVRQMSEAMKTSYTDPKGLMKNIANAARSTPETPGGMNNPAISALSHDNPALGAAMGAMKAASGLSAEMIDKAAAQKPSGNDMINSGLGLFDRISAQYPNIVKMGEAALGAVGGVATFAAELAIASKMLKMFGAGGGTTAALAEGGGIAAAAAGAGGMMMRGASAVLKGAGMAAGGIGIGLGAVHDVQSIQRGDTGSGIGGLTGTGVGMAAGAAIGTLTDWFTGPFGTIIGGIIGQQVGSWVGSMVSPHSQTSSSGSTDSASQAAAAVQPAMVGPAAPAAADMGHTQTYEENSISALMQLVSNNAEGNATLNHVAALLREQTDILKRDSGGSGTDGVYPMGRGLQSSAAVRQIGRPEA